MRNRKRIKNNKRNKLKIKKLVKKYPWLIPNSQYYTGRILKKRNWNYSWTWYDDMPRGWEKCFGNMFLEELDAAIRKGGLLDQFGIDQLKEKYGRLTVYVHGFNDEIMRIIDKYEYISANICISCGAYDVPMVNESWISPHCFSCFRKNQILTDKWYSENYKDYKPKTEEQIRDLYNKLTSDEKSDWKMPDSYTIRRFSKDGDTETTYDISDTVAKIRGRYEKK